MKLALSVVFCLVFLFSFGVSGYAQSINSGTVTGTVADESGAVVRGATVLLRSRTPATSGLPSLMIVAHFRVNNILQNNYQLTTTALFFWRPLSTQNT